MSLDLRPKYEIFLELTGSGEGDMTLSMEPTSLHLDLMPILKGDPGKEGDPGPSGNAAGTFTHFQSEPATVWFVNHDQNRRVSVELLTLGGMEMDAAILHTTLNQVRIEFNVPTVGYAICQ